MDGRLRRYYRLTASGAERLAAEAARVARNVRVANTRLTALRPGGIAVPGGAA